MSKPSWETGSKSSGTVKPSWELANEKTQAFNDKMASAMSGYIPHDVAKETALRQATSPPVQNEGLVPLTGNASMDKASNVLATMDQYNPVSIFNKKVVPFIAQKSGEFVSVPFNTIYNSAKAAGDTKGKNIPEYLSGIGKGAAEGWNAGISRLFGQNYDQNAITPGMTEAMYAHATPGQKKVLENPVVHASINAVSDFAIPGGGAEGAFGKGAKTIAGETARNAKAIGGIAQDTAKANTKAASGINNSIAAKQSEIILLEERIAKLRDGGASTRDLSIQRAKLKQDLVSQQNKLKNVGLKPETLYSTRDGLASNDLGNLNEPNVIAANKLKQTANAMGTRETRYAKPEILKRSQRIEIQDEIDYLNKNNVSAQKTVDDFGREMHPEDLAERKRWIEERSKKISDLEARLYGKSTTTVTRPIDNTLSLPAHIEPPKPKPQPVLSLPEARKPLGLPQNTRIELGASTYKDPVIQRPTTDFYATSGGTLVKDMKEFTPKNQLFLPGGNNSIEYQNSLLNKAREAAGLPNSNSRIIDTPFMVTKSEARKLDVSKMTKISSELKANDKARQVMAKGEYSGNIGQKYDFVNSPAPYKETSPYAVNPKYQRETPSMVSPRQAQYIENKYGTRAKSTNITPPQMLEAFRKEQPSLLSEAEVNRIRGRKAQLEEKIATKPVTSSEVAELKDVNKQLDSFESNHQPFGADPESRRLTNALYGNEGTESSIADLERNLMGTASVSDKHVVEIAKEIKDKSGITLNVKDVYRNFRDMFGKHYESIKAQYLDPFDASKGAYVDEIQKQSDKIYNNVVKDLGIKAGSKESAAVQWMGEGERVTGYKQVVDPITGKMINEPIKESYDKLKLIREFGRERADKIEKAETIFRQTYDDLVAKINDSRKKIYPNVESMTKPLKEQMDAIHADYSLTETEKKALVKQKFDEINDITRNKRLPYRKDYFHHFQEMATGFEGLKNIFDTPAQISSNLAGMSEVMKPNSKFAGFMQKRGWGPFKADAVGGFVQYINPASYAIHIDPNITKFRQLAKDIAEGTADTKNANNTIKYLTDFSNSLAGKTNKYDRLLQEDLPGGRKLFAALNWSNQRVKKNQVLGNMGSALSQVANVPIGIAEIKNPANIAKSVGDTIMGQVGKGSAPELYAKSTFLKERYSHNILSKFDQSIMKQPEKLAGWLLSGVDELGTKFIWNGVYRRELAKGAANPIKAADEMTRSLVAGRGIGEVPLLQQSKMFQVVAPFQLEVANLWHVMGDMGKRKDFGGIAMIMLGNYLFNNMTESVTGNRVTFDPIDAMIDSINEKSPSITKTVGRMAGEVFSNIPLGNTIASTIPEGEFSTPFGKLDIPTHKQLFGKEDPARFGTGLLIQKGMMDPVYKIAAPFGGAQIKKTVDSVQSLMKGGVYNSSGNLQTPVAPTTGNIIKGGMFGKGAFAETKKYYDSNSSPLSAGQTDAYREAIGNGMNSKDVYDQLIAWRDLKPIPGQKGISKEQRIESLRNNSKFNADQKWALHYLFVEPKKEPLPTP